MCRCCDRFCSILQHCFVIIILILTVITNYEFDQTLVASVFAEPFDPEHVQNQNLDERRDRRWLAGVIVIHLPAFSLFRRKSVMRQLRKAVLFS